MNKELVNNLDILAKYYNKTGDKFRELAYRRAIFRISHMSENITDIKQVEKVKDIGSSISLKIKEFLDNGNIQKVEEVKKILKEYKKEDEKSKVTNQFKLIWGMDKKAETLWDEGIKSLYDLKKHQDLLNRQERIGLKYYDELLMKIPRDYVSLIKIIIMYVLSKEFGKKSFKMEVAGSYRRGVSQSNDIDVLLMSKKFDLKQAVDVLVEQKVITDILSLGKHKFMGVAQCPSGEMFHVRLDIEFVDDDEEWGSSLLYFTGSKTLNIMMRRRAMELGFKLNQHGLFDVKSGQKISSNNEENIFLELGMNYIKPNLR